MLSQQIQLLRKQQGLSQQVLADRLHVVRQTVSKWEQGRSVPNAQQIQPLADALNTSVQTLLELEPSADAQRMQEQLDTLQTELRQATLRRHKRRFLALTVSGLVLLVLALLVLLHSYHALAAWEQLAPQVIGGADVATQIYVASLTPELLLCLVPLILLAAGLIGLWRTFRK